MNQPHLSSQFDNELNAITAKMMKMGGMVEEQIQNAMKGLINFDATLIESVIQNENDIDLIEVEIDADCSHIIARRQPTAIDLRLVMAITKTIVNLERVGDEAEKIARRTRGIMEASMQHGINFSEIKLSGEMAVQQLNRALSSFSRLDVGAVAAIMRDDAKIDQEFRAFVRKLITYMMEDPRCISVALDFLFIAKAIERIGDHAKNIAEFVIYVVEGRDVRHSDSTKQNI